MTSKPIRRRFLAATTVCVVAASLLAGCTSTPDPASGSTADDVTASLGAVPIPTAPPLDPVPTATLGTPQLLAMGAQTIVILEAGTDGEATATGPRQTDALATPSDPTARSTDATITLSVKASHGSIVLDPADLVCRNETGAQITLTPATGTPTGPVTLSAGSTATIDVVGHFESGAAQLTWRPEGRPIAIWDFNIELD